VRAGGALAIGVLGKSTPMAMAAEEVLREAGGSMSGILDGIDKVVPKGSETHAVWQNTSTLKTPAIHRWVLSRRPCPPPLHTHGVVMAGTAWNVVRPSLATNGCGAERPSGQKTSAHAPPNRSAQRMTGVVYMCGAGRFARASTATRHGVSESQDHKRRLLGYS
jgi:hypothetical protein